METADDRTKAPESDADLVERIRSSDMLAFRSLFERHQPILFRSMLAIVGDRDEAHDLVQETFVRVWDHRASLRADLPFLGYLFRTARNLVRDTAKRRAVRTKHAPDVPAPAKSEADDPEQWLYLRLLEERLGEVLRDELPDKCREVFVLSRMEGWTNGEIARQLGISVKTVENQITKALKIVRRLFRVP